MKRLLSLILVATLVISMASFISVSAEDVLFTESFENGSSFWKFNGSKANAENTNISTDKASDGKHSAFLLDPDTNTYGYRSNAIAAEAGRTYTVTYDAFNVEGVGGKVFVAFFDANGTRLVSTSFGTTVTGKWETITKDFTAPAGTVEMVLYLTGSGAGTGKSYVDNIKVTYDKNAKVEVPVVQEKPVNVVKGDVLYSESFENGLGEWKTADDQYYKITSDKAVDGKQSLFVSFPELDKSQSITSGSILIKPDMKYTATADFLDSEGTVKIYLQIFDAAGKRLSSTSNSVKSGNYTGSVVVSAPAEAASAKIVISSNTGKSGKAYVDNLKLIASGELTADDLSAKVIEEINKKIAAAKPGDVITIPDGKYTDVKVVFKATGTEAAPITLKAENPGKAIFTGESSVSVTGSYLVTEGLLFEKVTTKFIFVFEAATDHCVIKECAFLNCDPVDEKGRPNPSAQQKWIYIRGQYNKVTNCYMRGKTALGMMAEVIRSDANPNYHVIENSYFGDFKMGSANGLETIRIGTSPQSLSGSYSTVQGCFFESCDGEVETISVKSCNNFILNNTLYNNNGAIVLRHGNDTEVRGNVVIGGNKTNRITGVRIIGENHKVSDNYFYNTPASSTVLYVSNGNPNPLVHEYLEVKNADVHNNTFVNVDGAIVAGEYLPSSNNANNQIIPPKGKIYNNAIFTYKGTKPVISGDKNATELVLENNYVYGKELNFNGPATNGLINEKFAYEVKDGFFVPSNGTGANIEEVKKAPKSPYDVMPKWVKEQYYDTGKIKFNIVANDPFNKPESKVEDLFPIDGQIDVFLNGNRMKFDVNPQLINERTMVPMRAIFEAFGANVSWDEATATATAANYTTVVKITENSDIAYVNDKEYKLDSPAVIINGRFLVPVRFVSESFGSKVSWVDATESVLIEYTNNAIVQEFKPEYPEYKNALTVYAAIQSGDDGSSTIANVFDGYSSTKWAVKPDDSGNPAYGIFDLGSVKTLDKLYMSFQASETRKYTFSILVSEDGINYTTVIDKKTSTDKNAALEAYELNGAKARYIKYIGHGNNENTWNNMAEFVVIGM